MNKADRTTWVTQLVKSHGFAAVGIASVEPMEASPLRTWLDAGFAADMTFLERHLPLRADLSKILPGACSVICAAMPYPGSPTVGSNRGGIARYARGADYHDVLRERLQLVWEEIHARFPSDVGRVFVDSGPLPERELARRSGVGWPGRHSCLINPHLGTRFVLGEILTSVALAPSQPITGECSTCSSCIRACPTKAIVQPGIIDARRCLSYLTIEHKGPIPHEFRRLMGSRVFGCDTCQDVCQYNAGVGELTTPFTPFSELIIPDLCVWLGFTPAEFHARFRGTPIHRAKRRGLLRNVCVVLGNCGDRSAIPMLRQALHDEEPLVRGHAAWALGELHDLEPLAEALQNERDDWVREEMLQATKERK